MEIDKDTYEFLCGWVRQFRQWSNSDKAKNWQKERQNRVQLFSVKFSKENIPKLEVDDLRDIIKRLWATGIWTNKNYIVNKIIEENGLDKLRYQLKDLFYSEKPISKRFDDFKKEIKFLGPAYITELLVFVNPEKYCLWNEKPKSVLPFLRMENLLPPTVFKYQITGEQYEKCIGVLKIIKKALSENGVEGADFVDVDFFLAYIFYEILPSIPQKSGIREKTIDKSKLQFDIEKQITHEDAELMLLYLGNMLGYQTYTADPTKKAREERLGDVASLKEIPQDYIPHKDLESVKRIDVIWFDREQVPAYCFEVEHTTDVTKGLVRLYPLRVFNTKFFIIAPKEVKSKFETEINKDAFRIIKERCNFRSYADLIIVFKQTREYFYFKEKFIGSG